MKNGYGKLLCVLLVCGSVQADTPDPYATGMLFHSDVCGGVGFITARNYDMYPWPRIQSSLIVAPRPDFPSQPAYYASGMVTQNGEININHQHTVYWRSDGAYWSFTTGHTHGHTTACHTDLMTSLQSAGLTSPDLEAIEAALDWSEPPFESRLPMDTDLNGNGRLDYYDLDSPHYQDYLAMCAFFQIAPGDLRDYMYWYQNAIDDWYTHRMNVVDSNGDGWSDGYKAIRGYGPYDEVSFTGRPDIGSSAAILGGVASTEPWRYEEYADGWSRGHVYDLGYDPFGDTPIETINTDYSGPSDWYAMDSSGDGVPNAQKIAMGQDPYTFNFQSGFVYLYNEERGYWETVGGVTDEDFPGWTDPPTAEEWMADYEEKYGTGNYEYFPGDYTFGHDKYDALLSRFDKILVNIDSVRPQQERDYRVQFYLPIPGSPEAVTIAAIPDASMPAGAALNTLRLTIRAMSAVVISYLFIRHVWLVIRQY